MKEAKKNKEVVANLRTLSVSDLDEKSKNLEEEIFGLILKHRTGQLKTTSDIKATKRLLARVKTIATEKRSQEVK